MKCITKKFGEIVIEDDKIIEFIGGILGFADLTQFALIFDEEDKGKKTIQWLQSMQEPGFALPVIDPISMVPDYNPEIEDEVLRPMGDLTPDNMIVLTTITVPSDLTKMSINLKGPIIINADTKKARQVIVEGEQYQVKYPIYELLKSRKDGD